MGGKRISRKGTLGTSNWRTNVGAILATADESMKAAAAERGVAVAPI